MRHSRSRVLINSIKHFVLESNTAVTSGARKTIIVANCVVAPANADTTQVKEGSAIRAIHLEYWIRGEGADGVDTQQNVYVEKVPAGATAMTYTQALNPMAYPNKRNIMFSSQGVLGDKTTAPIPILNGWMLVPKGKQRMALGDKWNVTVAATGQSVGLCGKALFKEYY